MQGIGFRRLRSCIGPEPFVTAERVPHFLKGFIAAMRCRSVVLMRGLPLLRLLNCSRRGRRALRLRLPVDVRDGRPRPSASRMSWMPSGSDLGSRRSTSLPSSTRCGSAALAPLVDIADGNVLAAIRAVPRPGVSAAKGVGRGRIELVVQRRIELLGVELANIEREHAIVAAAQLNFVSHAVRFLFAAMARSIRRISACKRFRSCCSLANSSSPIAACPLVPRARVIHKVEPLGDDAGRVAIGGVLSQPDAS